MLPQEHKDLIEVLMQKTAGNGMTWERGQGRLDFQSRFKGRKFLVNKYFATLPDGSAPCLSLAIFNAKDALESEFTLCDGIAEQKDDYTLINNLYNAVSDKVPVKIVYSNLSLINSITQSLKE